MSWFSFFILICAGAVLVESGKTLSYPEQSALDTLKDILKKPGIKATNKIYSLWLQNIHTIDTLANNYLLALVEVQALDERISWLEEQTADDPNFDTLNATKLKLIELLQTLDEKSLALRRIQETLHYSSKVGKLYRKALRDSRNELLKQGRWHDGFARLRARR